MAFDIDLACYEAIAAIESDPGVTALVKPNCFLLQTQNGYTAKRQQHRIPNDYPQVRVELRSGFSWPGAVAGVAAAATQRTFCTVSGTPTDPASSLSGALQILITLIHDNAKLTGQTPLETAVRAFLLSLGATLGVTDGNGDVAINGYTVANTRRDEMNETTGQCLRTVTRLTINISARCAMSQLIGV